MLKLVRVTKRESLPARFGRWYLLVSTVEGICWTVQLKRVEDGRVYYRFFDTVMAIETEWLFQHNRMTFLYSKKPDRFYNQDIIPDYIYKLNILGKEAL